MSQSPPSSGGGTGNPKRSPSASPPHAHGGGGASAAGSAAAAGASSPAAPSLAAQSFDRLVRRVESAFNGGASGASGPGGEKKLAVGVGAGTKLTKLDDQAADVLFELDRVLATCDRSVVSKHQSSLEKLFLDTILLKCDNYVLRGVASSCLVKLLGHNSHNVSNWYHDLLKMLEGKEQSGRIIGLQCFAALSRRFGPQFLLSIPELLGVLLKLSKARDELVLRELLTDVVAAYYEGTTGSARAAGSTEYTHLDMLKLLGRFLGATTDRALAPPSLKKRVCAALVAVAYFSVDGREIDPVVGMLLKSLAVETEHEVRHAVADALGEILALSVRKDWTAAAADAAKRAGGASKVARKVQGELRSIDEVWQWLERQMLPLTQRSSAAASVSPGNLAARAAVNHVVLRFFKCVSVGNAHNLAAGGVRHGFSEGPGGEVAEVSAAAGSALDESNIVAQVVRLLGLLSRSKFTVGAASPSVQVVLGGPATLAMQTLPLPSGWGVDVQADQNARQMMALLSHTLLSGLLPFASERGLEAVGRAVVSFLLGQVKSGCLQSNEVGQNYQVLLAFQLLSFIFSRLGLAVEFLELKDQCLEALLAFLAHPQYAVRIACAQCFRSLARAASPQVATWLSVLVKMVALQLGDVMEGAEGGGMVTSSPRSGGGGGGGGGRESVDPAPYYSLHGHISALAAIVGVIPEAPCGVPSALLESVFDLAKRLLALAPPEAGASPPPTSAGTHAHAHAHAAAHAAATNLHTHTLVEGGWTLLGSLISLGVEWAGPRINALFLLWRGCLGRKPASGKQRQEDINLELKLRIRSLLALRSFVHVMRFRMICTVVGGVATPSPVLKATVVLLRNTFALLKALTDSKAQAGAGGGPQQGLLDPAVLHSVAALKSVLMDLFAALPCPSYQAAFVPLLHMVVSEFTSKAPPLSTELVRILARVDGNLNQPYMAATPPGSGGAEADLTRFVDLADASDSTPVVSTSTGVAGPSPTSFFEQHAAGGTILPDYSFNWGLRAAVQTEVAREVANAAAAAGGGGNHAGGAGSHALASGSTGTPNPALAVPGSGGSGGGGGPDGTGLDEGLAGERVLDAGGALDSFDDSFAAASSDSDAAVALGEESLSSRPLWSSLRNHSDRFSGPAGGGFGGAAHAVECFESAPTRAVNSAIRLFATLYADQSPTHKEQLIKHFLAIVTKARAMASLHSHIVTNAATALLAIARDVAERDAGGVRSAAALDIMVSIGLELMGAPNPLVRRAVAEWFGLLVRVEPDDAFLSKLFTALQNQLHAKDALAVSTAVFALGCVHRYGGAMKTMRYLPFTVAALQSLGRDFSEPFRLWILHALWLAIDTGGLSFAAYVQPTLAIVQTHAMHDVEARSTPVTQTIGRIIHAVLGALGPDVAASAAGAGAGGAANGGAAGGGSSGSGSGNGVDKFLNLWYHLQQESTVPSSQVESINILHQLVLWGNPLEHPGALPLLTRSLSSEDEEVRRAAVKCVLQYGEKEPRVILQRHLDQRIVAMVETEASQAMQALLKHTVATWILFHAGGEATGGKDGKDGKEGPASGEESIRYRLFDVCKRAVVGAHKLPSDSQTGGMGAGGGGAGGGAVKSKAARSAAGAGADSKEKDEDDEDDDGNILSSGGGGDDPASRRSKRAPTASSSSDEPSLCDKISPLLETRWQTKSFALDCLCSLLRTVHKSSSGGAAGVNVEFDLSYARRHARFPLQFVVQQLPDLLTVACLATSSPYDMMRIKGTNAMKIIVELFGDVLDPDAADGDEEDPDAPAGGELLLSLYSAQVTSALTQSMKNKLESFVSAPQLRSKACELAVVYLSSGITSDPMVFSRVTRMLLVPLQLGLGAAQGGHCVGRDVVDNLNNQFDGNMSTLVVLAHLNALGTLHATVIDNAALLANVGVAGGVGGAPSSSSSSSSRKKPRSLTPRQKAIVSLRDSLAPHFPLLTLHYFQALKDYVLVSTLSRREVGRLRGFYFDGAQTNNPLPVYLAYWETFLTLVCKSVEGEARALRGEKGAAAIAAGAHDQLVASDGSVGGERVRRELVAIALGVVCNTMHLVVQHEVRGLNGGTAGGGGGGAQGRAGSLSGPGSLARLPSGSSSGRARSNLDSSTLWRVERDKDVSCVQACMGGLASLLQVSSLRREVVGPSVLLELLPLLSWTLAHRPAGAETAQLARRQEGVLAVVAQLVSALREVVDDPAKLAGFLGSSPDDAGSVHPLLALLHALSELLSTAVHQFLPSYGGGGSAVAYAASVSRLAEHGVYLTPDVSASLAAVLRLLPAFVELAARIGAAVAPHHPGAPAAHQDALCLAVHLTQHYHRKATADLCAESLATLRALLFLNNDPSARVPPPAILTQQLAQQLLNVLLNPLPLQADFRVECLLSSLWSLTCASLATAAADATDATDEAEVAGAVARFVAVWTQFHSHGSSRFRVLALTALYRHVIVAPDPTLPPAVGALMQRALLALLNQVAPSLALCASSSDSVEESTGALQCLLHVFHALHPSHPASAGVKESLLPLLLPLLVDHLDRAPQCIVAVLALATQQAQLFKANVALLPLEYRTRLQRSVMSMSAEQQAAAMAQAQAVAQQSSGSSSKDGSAAAAATAKSSRKAGKSKRDSTSSQAGAGPAASAPPTIALSMDFARFSKK